MKNYTVKSLRLPMRNGSIEEKVMEIVTSWMEKGIEREIKAKARVIV